MLVYFRILLRNTYKINTKKDNLIVIFKSQRLLSNVLVMFGCKCWICAFVSDIYHTCSHPAKMYASFMVFCLVHFFVCIVLMDGFDQITVTGLLDRPNLWVSCTVCLLAILHNYIRILLINKQAHDGGIYSVSYELRLAVKKSKLFSQVVSCFCFCFLPKVQLISISPDTSNLSLTNSLGGNRLVGGQQAV